MLFLAKYKIVLALIIIIAWLYVLYDISFGFDAGIAARG